MRENPFDYILTGTVSTVFPGNSPEVLDERLRPYMQSGEFSGEVVTFVSDVCADAALAPLEFLGRLNDTMGRDFKSVKRLRGEPLSPEECLRTRTGACRDLAVLFMEACRAVGLPARFVSGYETTSGGSEAHELHAWAEVYIPGGGWRGYDPSMGLAVAGTHIALATGAHAMDAAAVTGAFRGSEAEAEMTYAVEIKAG
jgi:transglutaminase-like putative cysteine protease